MQITTTMLFYFVLFICIPRSAGLYICKHTNYTSSTFESNLNKVLESLVNNTSSSNGFNTSVSGRSPDGVYGLLQCWREATVKQCLSCSQDAITSIRQDCGNVIGGKAWLDKCFIRYENFSFFGILDTETNVGYSSAKITVRPDVISTAVNGLFTNLSNEALRSPLRFSSGLTTTSTSYTISSRVQCWSDLTSVEDCKTCLTNAISFLLDVTDNGTLQKAVAGAGSCVAEYERYTFFIRVPPPPPSPPLQQLSPPSIQRPPSSSPTPKKSRNKVTIIGIVFGILGGLLLMILLCLFAAVLCKPTLLRKEKLDADIDSAIGQEHEIIFNLKNINAATRNFHDDNKLGEGGYGPVYKGTMLDGKQIAVKKLSAQSLKGKREFLNEVKLVAKIQHRNLVKLLGCCTEQSEQLLVYEYLANKSLDKILFHPQRRKELDWPKRFNIIRGIASGLLYLHEDSHFRIIHRDIKASNILLDEKMEPKIADFGLARLIRQDESHVETRIAGTYGYMAPEYAMFGQLSPKVDVFSFGVVILEIICGRRNTNNNLPSEFQTLIEWVRRCHMRGNIVDVIDREIIESFSSDQVSKCIHLGLLCTQTDASLRPPMVNIYSMFSNSSTNNLLDPTMLSYLDVAEKNNSLHTSSTKSTTDLVYPSINDGSISDLGPR